jgi:translation initiation factor 3 subunit A
MVVMRTRAQKQLEAEETEKQRLIDEAKRREKEKFDREVVEIKKNEAKMREEDQKRIAEASAARQNAEKLVATIKRFDYFERACRKTEIPLLEKDYENQKKTDREAYEERKGLIIENARKRHEFDLAFKRSIDTKHYESFLEAATARAQQKYDEKLATAIEKLAIAKETRHHQVMEMRQAEFEKQKKLEEDRKKEMEYINRPKVEAAAGPGEWRRKEASPQQASAVPDAGIWRKPEPESSPQQEAPSHPGGQTGRYIPPSMRKKVI